MDATVDDTRITHDSSRRRTVRGRGVEDVERPCPYLSGRGEQGGSGQQCPLGFGSSGNQQGPKMGMMHCIICKSIMYKASTTNCGHTYCKDCIQKFRDCPACGADIVCVTENMAVDQAIQDFLSAHAGIINFWDLEDANSSMIVERAKAAPEKSELERMHDEASFYVQAGMRAMSGGNVPNALHRFEESRNVIEGYVSSQSKDTTSCLASLGPVYGALGDCHKALGDPQHALQCYQKSIEVLESAIALHNDSDDTKSQESDPFHALSVTMNKVGEMYHRQGDVLHALEMYKKALQVRQDRFDEHDKNSIPFEQTVSLMLDIATSQAKVADAASTCGHDSEAQQMNLKTLELLQHIEQLMTQCRSASAHARFNRLKEHYASMNGSA